MPTYDYKCSKCNHEFEAFQSIKEEPLKKCPHCGSETLKRLISAGGGIIFKGSGFYLTDYKNTGKPGKTADNKSQTPANSKPDTSSSPTGKSATKESSSSSGNDKK